MVQAHDEHILVVVLREENGCTALLRKDMDQAPVDHDMLVPLVPERATKWFLRHDG